MLLAIAAFVPVSRLMGSLTPRPIKYGVRAKWAWWDEHRQDFEVLFVGSSATAYGLVPGVFDQSLAARGHPLRSFNFGIGGMTGFEADHMVRQVLADPPPSLRYLFIEVSDWSPRVYPGKFVYSPRMVYWHTPEMTLDALRACLTVAEPTQGKDWRPRSAAYHGELFLRKQTGEGQGEFTVRALLGRDSEEVLPGAEDLERLHGYTDLDVIGTEEWAMHRERFLASFDAYTNRAKALPGGNAAPIPVSGHYQVRWFEQQIAAARAAGVQPIFYYAPRLASAPLAYRLHEAGVLPVFFGYNQPDRYPQLYRFQSRFDENHLSRRGADLFSGLIANDFADYLDNLTGE
ncbi:MAG TPA: hypothetical protein EYG30_07435 [Planctomycetes bacterium]|jgi:hypothetical protein|nr:hypothetical protein [Planctomycetota bacterium]HIL52072.1 hypothetical protein [Planctomycetota bacterium]